MPVQIYGLTDPEDGAIRYVGKSRDAEKRYRGHLGERRRKTPVYSWIADLAERGLSPTLVILGVCDESEWKDREKAFIAQFRAEGRLLNLADGGNQPWCPPETRAANGRKNAAARNKRLWWLKLNLGQALKRGYVSEATKDKMRGRLDVFGQFAADLK